MKLTTVIKTGIIILTAAMLLGGCGMPDAASDRETHSKRRVIELEAGDLAGKRIGVMTGSPQDKTVESVIENPEIFYFENNPDEALALDSGKIDSFICVDEIFRYMQPEHPKLAETTFVFAAYQAGVIFQKSQQGEKLKEQMNAYLDELNASGEMQQLQDYWFSEGEKEPIVLPETGENGTLSGAVSSCIPPYSYLMDEKRAGFDIALLKGFCERYGYGVRLDEANYAGMITGIVASKYDICISVVAWTEERAESVLFSDIYLDYNMVAIVREDAYPESRTVSTVSVNGGKNGSIWHSFSRTFLEEGRWKIILNGLMTTLIISALGFLLANALGVLFCWMTLSQRKGLRIAAEIYSRIMQGTPMVAILMILYYIVFGNSDLSGIVIAIIGFGIVTGAYLMQVFSGGISSVNAGQNEAALALGMTRKQAFLGIVFPQAVRRMLPGYFSQLISLIKNTSIVGYIAVVDLTKAGDIIRSTTFEAFFPIFMTAVIYFLISFLLLSLMKRIQKQLAPKRRNTSRKEESNDIHSAFEESL